MAGHDMSPYGPGAEETSSQFHLGPMTTHAGGSRPSDAAAATNAVPDINTILAELAQFSSAQQQPNQAAQISQGKDHQAQQPPQWNHHSQSKAQLANNGRSLDPRQNTQHRQTAHPPNQTIGTPFIDPASIFEWPQALRCVNKLSAQNPHFAPTIKVMISDQERNVQQWWKDRQALLKLQAGRAESVRQLNETLKAVGGKLATPPTPDDDAAEMDKFDLKVYLASQKMSDAHSVELKRLGVPFFGVSPKLIIANEIQQVAASHDPLSQAMITEAELLELQRKMIQFLEDMYKD